MTEGDFTDRDAIASALDWWALAGLGAQVEEETRDWLAPRPAAGAPTTAPAAAATPALSGRLPADLASFHEWLATAEIVPGAAPPGRRVAPAGDPASGLMLIADMPDPGEKSLFAGETARLFDAILAAIGRTREQVYCAPLSPWRMAGGRIDESAAEPLAAVMRHHAALVQPRALLLLLGESSRGLLGSSEDGPDGLRTFNHAAGTVPAIAIPHPRTLRLHPGLKARAWAALRLLNGVLAS